MQKLHPMNWSNRPSGLGWLARRVSTLLASAAIVTCVAPTIARADESAAGVEADAAKIRQLVFDMERAYEQVRDYTTTMYKQERVKGRLLPREEIQVKFRKPLSLYLKWTGAVNPGREVIYVKGWNDDKIRAHKGSFPDMTVNLRPDASLAMQGNRHQITEAHFGNVIGLIARDARLSESRPQDRVRYLDLGEQVVYGARSRCLEARTPSTGLLPIYYAARAKICFDLKTKMPTRIQVWDADGALLEDYGFQGTRLNVGLTDADFDPANADYNF
jgi:outer membrane lipoprotein-sorting protein